MVNRVNELRSCSAAPIQVLYFTRNRIPKWLKASPVGNYATAISNGCNIIEIDRPMYQRLKDAPKHRDGVCLDDIAAISGVQKSFGTDVERTPLWVPQGGAMSEASDGVSDMVNEIVEYLTSNKDSKPAFTKWRLVIASGTGSTALFAHHQTLCHKRALAKASSSFTTCL